MPGDDVPEAVPDPRKAQLLGRLRAEYERLNALTAAEGIALSDYCEACGCYLAGGMVERSPVDRSRCVECGEDGDQP